MSHSFRDGDRSCWYRFETDGERITLIVDAPHITAWRKWAHNENGKYMTEEIAKEFDLRPFVDEAYAWGFGGCCRYDGEQSEDWDRLTMPIPTLDLEGKVDYKAGYEAALSMEVLLGYLIYVKSITKTLPQGMTVTLSTSNRERAGGLVFAEISPAMGKWINDIAGEGEPSRITEVELSDDQITPVMRKTAAKLWGSGKQPHDTLFDSTRFSVLRGTPCFSGFGTLQLNGSTDPRPDGSYALTPHNCDGTIGQLTILTGLAKLDQLFHER